MMAFYSPYYLYIKGSKVSTFRRGKHSIKWPYWPVIDIFKRAGKYQKSSKSDLNFYFWPSMIWFINYIDLLVTFLHFCSLFICFFCCSCKFAHWFGNLLDPIFNNIFYRRYLKRLQRRKYIKLASPSPLSVSSLSLFFIIF